LGYRKISSAALLALMLVAVISALTLAGCGRKGGLDLPPMAAPAQQPPPPVPEAEPPNPPQR
jgi:predicted small lipoprotein YifL